jgi:hypothetical protein
MVIVKDFNKKEMYLDISPDLFHVLLLFKYLIFFYQHNTILFYLSENLC